MNRFDISYLVNKLGYKTTDFTKLHRVHHDNLVELEEIYKNKAADRIVQKTDEIKTKKTFTALNKTKSYNQFVKKT